MQAMSEEFKEVLFYKVDVDANEVRVLVFYMYTTVDLELCWQG